MGKLKRTIKEQQFIKAYINCNGNATKAYKEIHPNVKATSARALGSDLLAKLSIPITELLDLIGIDDHVITQKLNEGLTATRKIGKAGHKKTVPNYTVNQKYLDMILKIKAKYPVDKSRLELSGIGNDPISIILNEIVYDKQGKQVKKNIDKEIKNAKSVDK